MAGPKLQVPETLLDRGAAILSGGADGLGVPLVTIQCGELEQCEIIALLLHYLQMLTLPSHPSPSIATLINLSKASKRDISTFVESIQAVERPKRGRIAAVYCVKPKSRERSRQLKNLLGLKNSKSTNIPLFKVILVKNVHELFNYIDPSDLTEEYGGSLHYSHSAWLYFHKTVLPVVERCEELQLKLPAVKDRVELLQEYDLADRTSDQLMQLRQEQLQEYQTVLREIGLEECLEHCKQILHLLETRETDGLLANVHVTTLMNAHSRLRNMYTQLADDKNELNVLWTAAENRINITHRVQKCRERTMQIHGAVLKKYQQELADHPAVGKTLSQAELYRTHFTTSLYEPAKDLLTQATETLEELCRLSEECPDVAANISDVTRHLTDAINPFADDLQRVQDIYVSVHVFHLLFEKTVHWYKKVLKFLPDSLKQRVDPNNPSRLLPTPPEWRQAVLVFLTRHPPPREEHILRLDSEIPHQVDRKLKHEAHALALRVRFLQRLLKSKRLPSKLITAAFLWKEELMEPGSPIIKPQAKKHYTKSNSKTSRTSIASKPVKPRRGKSSHLKVDSPHGSKDNPQTRKYEHHVSQGAESKDGRDNFILLERKPGAEAPVTTPAGERFVRLTFTPNDPDDKSRSHFVFPEPVRRGLPRTIVSDDESPPVRDWAGSESGIEVLEQEDPYDSIVNKIREVSASRLPNDLKLKYVTDLLNVSLKRAAESSQTKYLDIKDDDGRIHIYPPSRSISMTKDRLGKSMGDLTDPAFYSSQGDRTQSIYSYDDNMLEEKQFEKKFGHLRCSFDPEDISVVLGVMNEDRENDEKMKHAYSTSDLTTQGEDSFMISKYRHSMFDLHHYPESLSSSSDEERESVLTSLDSADEGGSESTSLQFEFERLLQCQEERLVEEGLLVREQDRFDDIVLEAESLSQEQVAASLRRSEEILNQEGAAMSTVTELSNLSDLSDLGGEVGHPRPLSKWMSADLGYDSNCSVPVTPSHGSNTSSLQRNKVSLRARNNGPLTGPDFY